MNIHATCVAFGNKGVLLLGASGSGKSDLALRLISLFNASLVADDRVELLVRNNCVIATAPKVLQGMLEVRGIGIINIKNSPEVQIDLVIELTDDPLERMPDQATYNLCDKDIPFYRLNAFEPSAPAKVLAALRLL